MLNGGANVVPIAVPRFCLIGFFPNVNILFFNTTSAKSIRYQLRHIFLFGFPVVFLMQTHPRHTLSNGYNSATSIVHKIMSSGNFGRERSFFRNSLVS